MKLINPTLITINNTLHIKADNLEPVEVDSSCVKDFRRYAYLKYSETMEANSFAEIDETIANKGVDISELSDRIKVKHTWLDSCGDRPKAFLLPVKEDSIESLVEKNKQEWNNKQFGIEKSYTIEEIEKAIDETMPHKYSMAWDNETFKKLFLTNLTKI